MPGRSKNITVNTVTGRILSQKSGVASGFLNTAQTTELSDLRKVSPERVKQKDKDNTFLSDQWLYAAIIQLWHSSSPQLCPPGRGQSPQKDKCSICFAERNKLKTRRNPPTDLLI